MNGTAVPARERSSRATTTNRPATFVLPAAIVAILALVWIPPIRSSLWLDETGTFWVIKDGWSDALHRGYEFHGQPLYYLVTWILRHVFGSSELGLRVPSLLAMVGATYLIYRIGRRVWDGQTGLLAAVVFVVSRDVAFAAIDARPYAFLYLVAAGATLSLIRWLDEAKRGDAIAYAVLAALMLHLQALAFPVVLAHAGYALWRNSRTKPRRWPHLLAMAFGVGVLMLPGIGSFSWFLARSEALSIAGPPRIAVLLKFLVLPMCILGAAALLKRHRREVSTGSLGGNWGSLILPLSLLLLPPLTVFFISYAPSVRIFLPRYFGVASIGVGLVVAWAIRQLRPLAIQAVLAVALSAAGIVAAGLPSEHFDMDWRAAASFERARADNDTALLVQAGFVEGTNVDWLTDPERSGYLLAPLSYYRFNGDVTALPLVLDPPARDYLERATSGTLSRARRFIVITNAPDFLTGWFVDRTRRLGMTLREYKSFGQVSVADFRARS